jgi:hypothetical protein
MGVTADDPDDRACPLFQLDRRPARVSRHDLERRRPDGARDPSDDQGADVRGAQDDEDAAQMRERDVDWSEDSHISMSHPPPTAAFFARCP